jgi:hypothetical protein
MKTSSFLLFLLFFVSVLSSCTEDTLFRKLKPGRTGITFSNRITESEEYNIMAFEYVYN